MDNLSQHLRFAFRQLWRYPGFTVTVIITLALSIGANTAIFSLVNALLLKNLPYSHPERMGTIYTRITGPIDSDERHHLNGEQWELLRDDVPALVSAVSGMTSGVNLKAASSVQYVRDGRVSAHYFNVLAIQPVIGRNFSEVEDRPHGPKSVILSYGLWRNAFGLSPAILGQTIQLKGETYSVIGVLPQNATTPMNADVYTSLQPSRDGEGAGTNFDCITRLRDGATWQQADAQVNQVWSARSERYELNENPGAHVSYHSVPLQKGQTASLRPQVLGLMLAAGFILLIACGNLAGLTLVRMMRRSSEVATRLALGASRWQIQKQFWIENILLALFGGAAGIAVGFVTLRGLLSMLPENRLPVAHIAIDIRVLAFTLAVSLLTSVLFGMLPAFVAGKVQLRPAMGARTVARFGSVRMRQVLTTGQMALTVVLLAGAGLLIRSLLHLENLPPGFNPSGVTVAKVSLDDVRYHDTAAFTKLLTSSTEAMQRIPGVQSAAVGLSLPYERTLNDNITLSDGKEAGRQVQTDEIYVTPGYFQTLQIPVLAGRAFTDEDRDGTQRVAIVNRAFAEKFYGGSNPVGRYFNKDTVIVGEVANVFVSSGLYEGAPLMADEAMYLPASQMDAPSLAMVHVWFQPDWIVRTSTPIEGIQAQMQGALSQTDPNLPASGFYNMDDLMAQTLSTQRIESALLGAMAGLALLLSALGISALVANMVAQRTREIGIRIALGSTVSTTMIQFAQTGTGPSVLGVLLGLAVSAEVLRALRSELYGVGTYDPVTLVAVSLTLLLVTGLAAIVPTFKIARIDPARTLREE